MVHDASCVVSTAFLLTLSIKPRFWRRWRGRRWHRPQRSPQGLRFHRDGAVWRDHRCCGGGSLYLYLGHRRGTVAHHITRTMRAFFSPSRVVEGRAGGGCREAGRWERGREVGGLHERAGGLAGEIVRSLSPLHRLSRCLLKKLNAVLHLVGRRRDEALTDRFHPEIERYRSASPC